MSRRSTVSVWKSWFTHSTVSAMLGTVTRLLASCLAYSAAPRQLAWQPSASCSFAAPVVRWEQSHNPRSGRCWSVAGVARMQEGGDRFERRGDSGPSFPPTLKILPNIDYGGGRAELLSGRRLPGPDGFVDRDFESYPYALAPSMDNGLEIAAMAGAEFSDWLRRTVDRNVNGIRYTFDRQQWKNGFQKWWARLLEADEHARMDFARLYPRMEGMNRAGIGGGGVAGGGAGIGHHARPVEEDWGHIYLECVEIADEARAAAGGSKPRLAPVTVEADDHGGDSEMIDCAMRGKWRLRYDEDDGAEIDFSPRQ